jgi:integrase
MSKKEIKVPNFPGIYKIVTVSTDGTYRPTGQYRVRRRFSKNHRWSTHTNTVDSFEDAKRLAKQRFVPSQVQVRNDELSFEDAFAKFMKHKEFERKLAKGTIIGYWARYEHLKFFDPMPMVSINSRVLDSWIDLLLDPEYVKAQQGSRICYDHEFTLLVCFFKFYRNFIDESFVVPVLDRHRQRACARSKSSAFEIRFLNSEEERLFLKQLEPWPMIQDIALFQLHTGARIGEASAMEFRNVDFSRNEVRIAQHLHWERHKDAQTHLVPGTKTGPNRNVPLTSECMAMLKRRVSQGTHSQFASSIKRRTSTHFRSS